ncbi:hypothetical protein MICA_379 [Micavibrio aeruginosavorus ARL-13]|uniref:Uncharacterized protein n=1 Tax=Micavibrio aeruginosavorus (strain ARL-13) TaxID=856793 RepID=G2KR72_MICAA|nr:hypothetical protein MICA_379 [Micavibrio aeruginosavorus ARL-13]
MGRFAHGSRVHWLFLKVMTISSFSPLQAPEKAQKFGVFDVVWL